MPILLKIDVCFENPHWQRRRGQSARKKAVELFAPRQFASEKPRLAQIDILATRDNEGAGRRHRPRFIPQRPFFKDKAFHRGVSVHAPGPFFPPHPQTPNMALNGRFPTAVGRPSNMKSIAIKFYRFNRPTLLLTVTVPVRHRLRVAATISTNSERFAGWRRNN